VVDDPAHRPAHAPWDEPPPRRAALPWLLVVLAVGLLVADLARRLDDRERDRRALAQARDEAAELRRSLFRASELGARAETARAERAKVADALEGALASKAQERDTTDKLISQLKAQLDAKDGEVSQGKSGIAVNLVDEILFPSGEAALSPRGKEVLSRVGGVLSSLTDKQIWIGGHTDDRPIHTERFPSNWELSSARAVNVARYLTEIARVDPRKVTAAAMSEFHPRSADRAKNRRIEILLTPVLAEAYGK
jgi:chemotaxis protein MotB